MRKGISTRLLVASTVAVLAAGAAAPAGFAFGDRPADAAYYDAVGARIDAVLEDARRSHLIPGAIAAAEIPGKALWVRSAGWSDVSTGAPPRIENEFRIASLTKTFTATVVLQLAEEGRLSLEDGIADYVDAYTGPHADRITVRHLLGMTSGIFDYGNDDRYREESVADLLRVWDPAELVAFACENEPYFEPGEGYEYSNTNYVLLGMIVEKVTGNALGDEIRRRIIDPLGLSHTRFATDTLLVDPHSHGYSDLAEGGDLRDVSVLNPSFGWAAGAIVSKIEDLGIWARALAAGALLGEEMHREQIEPGPSGDYGLGVMYSAGFYGHEGHILGFNSIMMHRPVDGATMVVMVNRADEIGVAGKIWGRVLFTLFPLALRSGAAELAAGETATLSARVRDIVFPFDAYAVLLSPSGGAFSVQPGNGLAAGIVPFVAGRPSASDAGELELLRVRVPPGAPRGTYRIILGLVAPGDPPSISAARCCVEGSIDVR